ncbi:hypothetical protein [Algoriphagus sp. Y33]|uniref:hypothetical protein n=1 Tax=Algoriphagus sp. Y33 TaxID=2772483 RepID=UPI001786F0F3|nr:hypothetical protein [Algoriphagus sp. Y33]
MKNKKIVVALLSLSTLLILSNCKEKEEPVTDYSQFMMGEWTISEIFTLSGEPEIIDDCNRETTYNFMAGGVLNVNPRATASDGNSTYCAAVLNDGLGVDVNYLITGNRMESELGNATLEKISNSSAKLTFDEEEFGIVVLVR